MIEFFYPIICQLLGLSGSMNSLGTKQKRFFRAASEQRESFAIAKQVDFLFFFANVRATRFSRQTFTENLDLVRKD